MATYPAFAQLQGSSEEVVDDIKFERAVDGSGRGRVMYSAPKRRFTVKHRLEIDDKESLITFYDTNRGTIIDFVWAGDGLTYSCAFERAPRLNWIGAEAEIEVVLGEV